MPGIFVNQDLLKLFLNTTFLPLRFFHLVVHLMWIWEGWNLWNQVKEQYVKGVVTIRRKFLDDLNTLMLTLLRWKWATFDLLPAFFPVQLRGKSTGNTYFPRKKCSLARLKLCFANKIFTICQKASSEKILSNFADGTDRLLKSNLSRFYSTYKMRWLSIDWKLAKVGL